MPVTYDLDHNLKVIWQKWEGHVTVAEAVSMQATVKRECPENWNALVDITGVSGSDITLEQLQAFGRERRSYAKVAIVIREEGYQFGMVRAFELTANAQQNQAAPVRLFRSLADALLWLQEGAPAEF